MMAERLQSADADMYVINRDDQGLKPVLIFLVIPAPDASTKRSSHRIRFFRKIFDGHHLKLDQLSAHRPELWHPLPKHRHSSPQLRHPLPDLWQSFPKLRHSSPQLRHPLPYLWQSFPKLRRSLPQLRQSSPQLRGSFPMLRQSSPVNCLSSPQLRH
jgi:hypothetical protein